MTRTLLLASASEAEAARLTENGPRRDFLELARETDAEIVYAAEGNRGGLLGRLLGPHVRQAWRAAGIARREDAVFADGEHNGLPLLLALRLRGKRARRVVMLGHLLSRRWKLPLLALATRLHGGGLLLLHSVEQERIVRRWIGPSWRVALTPYQVDTAFWRTAAEPEEPPLIVAAGSENRDYTTLVEAARGLPARVVIAAGSHWARSTAQAHELPENVEYLSEPLSFTGLRDLYDRASVIAVPLNDVRNQSGVTTILEGMSMGRPIVVSATRGQREVVTGPLVDATGALDPVATADRGPRAITEAGPETQAKPTGLYVPAGDAAALRAALERLLADRAEAAALGAAGRQAAERDFDVDRYVAGLAGAVDATPDTLSAFSHVEAAR